MNGHEGAKSKLLAYLEQWIPIRCALIRDETQTAQPADPENYLQLDQLPDDENLYPLVMARSSTVVGKTMRGAIEAGKPVTYDVDYEVELVVGAISSNEDGQVVVRERDRLLLALRDCLMLPGQVADDASILKGVAQREESGPAVQTVQGKPIAAGAITVRLRQGETLMPTVELERILETTVTVTAADPSADSIPTD